jgi:hypothetical protein
MIAQCVMDGTIDMQTPLQVDRRRRDVRYHGFVVSFITWVPKSMCGRGGSWQKALYHLHTSVDAHWAIKPCLRQNCYPLTTPDIALPRLSSIPSWTL